MSWCGGVCLLFFGVYGFDSFHLSVDGGQVCGSVVCGV